MFESRNRRESVRIATIRNNEWNPVRRVREMKTTRSLESTSWKSMVNTFLQNSSICALQRIGKSPTKTVKRIWAVIFIVGTVGCVSQVSLYLATYFQYPVVLNFESVNVEEEEFPAVTVCNKNMVLRTYETCLKHADLCAINNFKPDVTDRNSTNDAELLCNFPELLSKNNNTSSEYSLLLDSLSYETLVSYGHRLENFVTSCVYNGQLCGHEDFITSYSFLFGNCFTFNFGGNRTTKFDGPTSGLELQLDLEVDEYATSTSDAGAWIQIHEPQTAHDVETKGFALDPGAEHYLAVTKSVISRLPAPYKDRCREYETGNSKAMCQVRCFDSVIQMHCQCTYMFDGERDALDKQCDMTNPKISCCVRSWERIMDCECPLACHEILYDVQLSSADWPSRAYYEHNKNEFQPRRTKDSELPQPSFEDVSDNYLRIKIYYDTLKYTMFRQLPAHQSSEVLSQIGGQMGLWLGLSLVALFECVESVIILYKRRSSRVR